MRYMTEWKARSPQMNEQKKEMNISGVDGSDEKKLLSVLGLCAKAGSLVFGVPQICEVLAGSKKKGKYPLLVIEAGDTSENTHKRISDKCAYYKVEHIRLRTDGATLAHALGKTSMLAAVAITDENLCRLAQKNIR